MSCARFVTVPGTGRVPAKALHLTVLWSVRRKVVWVPGTVEEV
jgi:hypothetical protein